MRDHFLSFQHTANNLADVERHVIAILMRARQQTGTHHLGYVSGIITSDGPEHIARNIRRLTEYADTLRSAHPFPIFAPPDVFTDTLFARLPEIHLERDAREAAFMAFWRTVLHAGHVTDIFMTPRWEVSVGAKDEHRVAQELGLRIHYVGV